MYRAESKEQKDLINLAQANADDAATMGTNEVVIVLLLQGILALQKAQLNVLMDIRDCQHFHTEG
jgi:hypothetical protein